MRISYIGNFQPGVPSDEAFSTENDVAKAIIGQGHHLNKIQENSVEEWRRLANGDGYEVDLILWTRTGWNWPDYGTDVSEMHNMQRAMLNYATEEGVPTVGLHLDKWFGLRRQYEVTQEPFFWCSLVCTADGAHDEQFKAAGVNHHWMMPAVNAYECERGTYREDMASDFAFVGSYLPGYHPEHVHRPALIEWLKSDPHCRFWPAPGAPAVRGKDLRDLYASTKVNIGDSCLCEAGRYVSDRVPETVGRGGFLLHPYVEGVTDGTHYVDGVHLVTWPLWNWSELREKMDYYATHDREREAIAATGQAHVLAHHTYTKRIQEIIQLVGL